MIINSLLIYTFCIFLAWLFASNQYKKRQMINGSVSNNDVKYLSIAMIVTLATICTLFNVFITEGTGCIGGDRTNYRYDFETGRLNPSIGFTFLMYVAHYFQLSFKTLLYFCTFAPMFIMLWAYRKSQNATPEALLLFFLTPFLIFTFTGLKQSYSAAFTALSIILMLQKGGNIKTIICWISIVIACLFHPSGYLALILYFVLKLNIKIDSFRSFLIMVLFVVFFKPALIFLANTVSGIIPFLSNKIYEYFGGSAVDENNSFILILKGLPYYVISYATLKNQNTLKKQLVNYNKFMLLSLLCSLFFLVSYFSVWMARLEYALSLPVMIFFAKAMHISANVKKYYPLVLLSMAFFTYRLLILVFVNFGFF